MLDIIFAVDNQRINLDIDLKQADMSSSGKVTLALKSGHYAITPFYCIV